MAEMRGTLSGKMVTDMNHDFFKVMVRSFASYNRLADTERALATERKRREETLTKLEKAKDNVSVAQAEKEEILYHECKMIEENKILKTDHARLDRELEQEKKKVAELRKALENAESTAIANFKKTDDYQEILMPVFLEGFAHAKAKFSVAFPDLDISKIKTGSKSTATEGQDNEVESGEERAATEEQAEGVQHNKGIEKGANVQVENTDGASATQILGTKTALLRMLIRKEKLLLIAVSLSPLLSLSLSSY